MPWNTPPGPCRGVDAEVAAVAAVKAGEKRERPHAVDESALRTFIGAVPHTPVPQALRGALAELNLASDAAPLARA
jgi:hypothetical protein